MKLKGLTIVVLTLLLLVGCGNKYKVGEEFVLADSLLATKTIEIYYEPNEDGIWRNDGENRTILFDGDLVKIIAQEEEMVLLEVRGGLTDVGEKWWTHIKNLENSTK